MDEATANAPHQGFSFERLARSYNFRRTSDWPGLFVRLVVDELARLPGGPAVVDIGSGSGIGGDLERLHAIRAAAGELWGVEPDQDAQEPPGVFDAVRRSSLERAGLPAAHFDLAYSFMVMEHVDDPAAFLAALRAALKDGGTYIFATVNGRHYFARTARAARRLGVDERLLRLVRKTADVDRYHHPVRYAFNTPAVIDRYARDAGFAPPEYVFLEQDGPADYMRGPLRPALRLLQWKRSLLRRPESLLTMFVRMRAA